jgi:hypothetical protein
MLTIKEFMELIDYRITEGSDYCWRCFGDNAYSISSWNGDQDGWSFAVVFDTKTQCVYTVEACDYKNNRAYRMINPEYRSAYEAESKQFGHSADEAWDDVDYVDLETVEDFVTKSQAIKAGVDYDTRVDIVLDLTDEEISQLMTAAHDADMTVNQYVEYVLQQYIDSHPILDTVKKSKKDKKNKSKKS